MIHNPKIECMSREEMTALQSERLRKQVKICYEKIPFYRNKMDKEIFNKAIQNYIADPEKSIPKLMEYAGPLRVKKLAKDLIGVWL